jgi:hypothetical protein
LLPGTKAQLRLCPKTRGSMIVVGGKSTKLPNGNGGKSTVTIQALFEDRRIPIWKKRTIVRELRSKVISLPSHSRLDMTASDQRIKSLFGNPEIPGGSLNFWRNRLGRLYHKSYRYLAHLAFQKLSGLALRYGIFSEPTVPVIKDCRVSERERVVLKPSTVTEVIKGLPTLPWMAEMPFFESKLLPVEEPWWADGRLPPSKEAFIEHFYPFEVNGTAQLIPEAYPSEGFVTILLNEEELVRYSRIFPDQVMPGSSYEAMSLVNIFVQGGDVPWYHDDREHICSHVHPKCTKSETISGFVRNNPWHKPKWAALLKEALDAYWRQLHAGPHHETLGLEF